MRDTDGLANRRAAFRAGRRSILHEVAAVATRNLDDFVDLGHWTHWRVGRGVHWWDDHHGWWRRRRGRDLARIRGIRSSRGSGRLGASGALRLALQKAYPHLGQPTIARPAVGGPARRACEEVRVVHELLVVAAEDARLYEGHRLQTPSRLRRNRRLISWLVCGLWRRRRSPPA